MLLKIIEDQLAISALYVGHIVPGRHPTQAIILLRPAHALRGYKFEIVTCRAGIERLLATGSFRQILRTFVTWREGRRLRACLRTHDKRSGQNTERARVT